MKLTPEEKKLIKTKIIERLFSKLVARDLMPVRVTLDTGWLFKQEPERSETDIILPIIHNTYSFDSSTKFDSRKLYNAVDMVAEEEDTLILTGEYTSWAAFGIKGLLRSAGTSLAAVGSWPINVFDDIIQAKTFLRELCGVDVSPILIIPLGIYSALEAIAWEPPKDYIEDIEPKTYLNFLLNENLVRAIYPTNCLFASDAGMDSVLLYQPTQENYILSTGEPKILIQEKEDKTFISISEAVTPVIRNPSTIVEIHSILGHR